MISKKDFSAIFAERVRNYRINAKISQQELGEVVGLSKQAINDIEKARRITTIDKAIAIAQFFNTTVEYLGGATDNPSRDSFTEFSGDSTSRE